MDRPLLSRIQCRSYLWYCLCLLNVRYYQPDDLFIYLNNTMIIPYFLCLFRIRYRCCYMCVFSWWISGSKVTKYHPPACLQSLMVISLMSFGGLDPLKLGHSETNSGWWFGTFFYFPMYWESSSQLTNIFQRGGPTTNQNWISHDITVSEFVVWWLLIPHLRPIFPLSFAGIKECRNHVDKLGMDTAMQLRVLMTCNLEGHITYWC